MTPPIPEPQALSDALSPHFDGRRVTAAVFLTYTFEPDFFELRVLPMLMPSLQLSPIDRTALWQVQDALRTQLGDVAVYYDQRGLIAGQRSAQLDARRIPCKVPTGVFHPKVLLALTEPADESDDPQQLVVLVSSANLTQAGWWENVEVAHIEVVDDGAGCSFRNDLLHLISVVKKRAMPGADHTALEAVRRFVKELQQPKHMSSKGILLPRLYAGQEPLADWLMTLVPKNADRLCLEVISPFFDATEARPLKEMIESLDPVEVRVFLPIADDGRVACDSAYYDAVEEIRGAQWGTLPDSLLAYGKGKHYRQRRVHAKVYRLFDRKLKYEAQLVGSVNLTNAAHDRGGNLEAAFFIEQEAGSPKWWLKPIEDEPSTFRETSETEETPQLNARLAVRFDWSTTVGEVFWDDAAASAVVQVTAQGAPVLELRQLPPRNWLKLDKTQSALLGKALEVTSFLVIREMAGEYTILVDESGMARKPTLRHELTVADILKSWSLFTPEQRAALIEDRGSDLEDGLREAGYEPRIRALPPSFFDVHSGIFLAFGDLERRITNALHEGRDREIEYWIAGRQFDSLLTLLERARSEGQNDVQPVREYLMLLCTKQLLDAHPELTDMYPDGIHDIQKELESLQSVRDRFSFADGDERDVFLKWFEKWFIRRAEPLEAH